MSDKPLQVCRVRIDLFLKSKESNFAPSNRESSSDFEYIKTETQIELELLKMYVRTHNSVSATPLQISIFFIAVTKTIP